MLVGGTYTTVGECLDEVGRNLSVDSNCNLRSRGPLLYQVRHGSEVPQYRCRLEGSRSPKNNSFIRAKLRRRWRRLQSSRRYWSTDAIGSPISSCQSSGCVDISGVNLTCELLGHWKKRLTLLYSNLDLISNTAGIVRWAHNMPWSGQAELFSKSLKPWTSSAKGGKAKAGTFKTVSKKMGVDEKRTTFAIVTIDNAGHLVGLIISYSIAC